MLKNRLIASLLIKDGLIVQSFEFNKYLPIGKPRFSIEFVAKWDVDEIVLLDISASAKGKKINSKIIEKISNYCYVPLTVGGGIKTVKDVQELIRAGADKISINKSALERPLLISEISKTFGTQCVVVSIDCKREPDGTYIVYKDSGRVSTQKTASEWVQEFSLLGAGEIYLNSIDRDGCRNGYDLELINLISQSVDIPVIACGGVGKFDHFADGISKGKASAVAASNIFHHVEHSTIIAKAYMKRSGINVRLDGLANYENRKFDENGRLIMHSGEYLSELDLVRRT